MDHPAGRSISDFPDQADRAVSELRSHPPSKPPPTPSDERGAVMDATVVLNVGIEPQSLMEQLRKHVKAETALYLRQRGCRSAAEGRKREYQAR
jgi:hypothetical protein